MAINQLCLKIQNIRWHQCNETKKYIDLSSVSLTNNSIISGTTINSDNAPSRAQQIVKTGDIIFGTTRPNLMRCSIIPDTYNNQICSTGFCIIRTDKTIAFNKWIYYSLQTNFFKKYVIDNQSGTSYPSISDKTLKQFKLNVPPLTVQQQIITILDNFEQLSNNLSTGIPAEIEARKKQYEYYRDKLLSFDKVTS